MIGHIKGRLVADLAFLFCSTGIRFTSSRVKLSSGRLSDFEAGKSGVKGLGYIHCLPLNISQLLLLKGYLSLVHSRTVLLRLLKGAGALEAIREGFGIGRHP